MKMKKCVLCVFDGSLRLWQDDMLLDTGCEVRMKLGDGTAYITDLDVPTMRRSDALHHSTEEEKGHWIIGDPTDVDLGRKLLRSVSSTAWSSRPLRVVLRL